MSSRRTKNKRLLGLDLESLIKQAVLEETKELSGEKDLQKSKASELKPFKHRGDDKSSDDTDEAEGDDDLENTTTVTVKKNSLPEITIGKLIELVNLIRSGKSMKDKNVLKQFKTYYQRLNGSERVALYAFLTGISQVVLDVDEQGEPGGAEAETPTSDPYDIEMKRKTPKETKEKKKASGSPDSPIVVGEHADKSREKLLIKRNR